MFVQDRDQARRVFLEVRQKYNNNQPLEALERIILDVILSHPEYHSLLEDDEDALARDFNPDAGLVNPFLHMGMHIAIKEQIGADRPAGIRSACDSLSKHCEDVHDMEHKVMECLGESLWLASRNNTMPDEQQYLENIRALK